MRTFYQESRDWYKRYIFKGGWKSRSYPEPSSEFQIEELGHEPETKFPEDWQWKYNPRSSISRKRFKEWIEE